MAYEKLRIGHSPLTDRIYLGRVGKDGSSWVGEKKDVTNDFLGCVLSRWSGFEENIVDGKGNTYVVSVKKFESEENKNK